MSVLNHSLNQMVIMDNVKALFVGDIQTLEPEGQRSGIYKRAIEAVYITTAGLVGDHQADKRYHGGPDKAVHQFSARAYQLIVDEHPMIAGQAVPGSFGENLFSEVLDERNVCIGDKYRIGRALLQVSEPRRPCWKINRKFNLEGLSMFVERQAICGWYYRVLEPGHVRVGDTIMAEYQAVHRKTIAEFTRIITQHRPTIEDLSSLLMCEGLSETWCTRLKQRLEFLRKAQA